MMEAIEQRPPKPEDRSRVEVVDGLVLMDCGDGTMLTYRTEWTYRDDWRWFGGGWANFGHITCRELLPRIEGTPPPPKRSWLRRLFGR